MSESPQCLAPAPFGAVPSSRQLQWHRLEFYGFIHFTTNTFTGKEWGYGDEGVDVFAPSSADARQWARIASQSGMKGLILTCKHHDGFCLWPSEYTEHSVKNSPWKNGKGDVVRELSDACREFGLRFGVYLSPWDRNHPAWGTEEYITYFRNQLRELLTNYGPVFEVWFDGACGGDGYYGGACETRTIERLTYYDWANTFQIVRELQPDAVIFSDIGPDVRWIGNEHGTGSETNWCTLNIEGRYPGYSPPGYNAKVDLGQGHEDADNWIPAEADVSIRPGWFYHQYEDSKVRTPAQLLDLYYRSVGRGASLHLNLPPDQRGMINEIDEKYLLTFSGLLREMFKTNLAPDATITASNTRADRQEFSPANLTDGNAETYWATDDDMTSATVELEFSAPQRVNHVIMQEHIALGQRVCGWTLEGCVDGQWQELCRGTTIGYKRVIPFGTVEASRIRLRIDSAKACPVLNSIEVYNAPKLLASCEITRDRDGLVSIAADSGAVIRYTTDGSTPDAGSPVYQSPFALPRGGVVGAAMLSADNPDALDLADTAVTQRLFGLTRNSWKILHVDSQQEGFAAQCAIDDDPKTFWLSQADSQQPHEICIDLGQAESISALGYLPRQDGKSEGMVDQYAFYVSDDPADWGQPVSTGRFDNIVNNPIEQVVELDSPATGRYVRFVCEAAANGHPAACAAEINVYAQS